MGRGGLWLTEPTHEATVCDSVEETCCKWGGNASCSGAYRPPFFRSSHRDDDRKINHAERSGEVFVAAGPTLPASEFGEQPRPEYAQVVLVTEPSLSPRGSYNPRRSCLGRACGNRQLYPYECQERLVDLFETGQEVTVDLDQDSLTNHATGELNNPWDSH